ncbi:hypothetical protein A6R68_05086, partial [Neotoma lepida]
MSNVKIHGGNNYLRRLQPSTYGNLTPWQDETSPPSSAEPILQIAGYTLYIHMLQITKEIASSGLFTAADSAFNLAAESMSVDHLHNVLNDSGTFY